MPSWALLQLLSPLSANSVTLPEIRKALLKLPKGASSEPIAPSRQQHQTLQVGLLHDEVVNSTVASPSPWHLTRNAHGDGGEGSLIAKQRESHRPNGPSQEAA
jgi:hypothetical protein